MEACLRYYGLRRRVLLGCQRSRPTWYRHGYDAPCAFTDRRSQVSAGCLRPSSIIIAGATSGQNVLLNTRLKLTAPVI